MLCETGAFIYPLILRYVYRRKTRSRKRACPDDERKGFAFPGISNKNKRLCLRLAATLSSAVPLTKSYFFELIINVCYWYLVTRCLVGRFASNVAKSSE